MVQNELYNLEGQNVSAKDVYTKLKTNNVDFEFTFNKVRNTIHELFDENWFSAGSKLSASGPYGTYIVYSNISTPNCVDSDPVIEDVEDTSCCGGDCGCSSDFVEDVQDEDDGAYSPDATDVSLQTLVTKIVFNINKDELSFSAYDVTAEARELVNSGVYTIDGGSTNIGHDCVRTIVEELFEQGLFYFQDYKKNFVKEDGKRYVQYSPM